MSKPIKMIEHTYGTHIYMKMRLDNNRIEEIDVYYSENGTRCVTSVDHGMELYTGKEFEERKSLRQKIIDTFNSLY